MNKILLFLPLIFLACTKITTLIPEAKNVQILLKEPVNCKFLGEIEGYKTNDFGNLSLKGMKESAKNDLKNNAQKIGANAALIIN